MLFSPAMQRGFSLVEVLVALTIFIAIAVGVAQLFASSTTANAAARAVTVASILAMEKLEELRALSIDDPAVAVSPPDSLRANVDGYFDAPRAGYTRRWMVAPVRGHAGDAVAIYVTVTHARGAGGARLATIKVRKAG